MVPRLRGQDLLFGGAETLDFAPLVIKSPIIGGAAAPPAPPITTSLLKKQFVFNDLKYTTDE